MTPDALQIPPEIPYLGFSADAARWYLAGIIDGEGYVTAPGKGFKAVVIANTDWSIVEAAQRALGVLSIPFNTYYYDKKPSGHKPSWIIRIGTWEGVDKIFDLIPLKSASKADRLRGLVETGRRRWLDEDQRPIEEIRRLYEQEQLSIPEIADIVGWNRNTVYRWMREASVQLRSQQAAQLLRWRSGIGEIIDEAVRLYVEEELSTIAVAERLCQRRDTVNRWLRDRGVLRSRGEALSIRNKREARARA